MRIYNFVNKLNMKSTSLTILVAIQLIVLSMAQGRAGGFPEAKEDIRIAAAKSKLTAEPLTALVYVKGLYCPSCAIGIRKKVSMLSFVDKKRLNKGVELDTKTQLATVALTERQSMDPVALAQAIRDAGYDPVDLYTLDDGQIKTQPLGKP